MSTSDTLRIRLPNRRGSTSFEFEQNGLRFICTYSILADGRLAEIFLQTHKPGSQADINARDSAIAASLALQFGCPVEDLERALSVTGPLGTALKAIAAIAPTCAVPIHQ